jgi:hypothetical protein
MGNGEWGMGNGKWVMGNGEGGKVKKNLFLYPKPFTLSPSFLPNSQLPIPNAPIKQGVNLVLSFLWFLYFTLDNNATNPVPEISP